MRSFTKNAAVLGLGLGSLVFSGGCQNNGGVSPIGPIGSTARLANLIGHGAEAMKMNANTAENAKRVRAECLTSRDYCIAEGMELYNRSQQPNFHLSDLTEKQDSFTCESWSDRNRNGLVEFDELKGLGKSVYDSGDNIVFIHRFRGKRGRTACFNVADYMGSIGGSQSVVSSQRRPIESDDSVIAFHVKVGKPGYYFANWFTAQSETPHMLNIDVRGESGRFVYVMPRTEESLALKQP